MANTDNNFTPEELQERIEYLSQFLLDQRYATICNALDQRTDYMGILTENMFHEHNASAVIRHCEAFGLQELHTIETLCRFSPATNIVHGTDKWVDIIRHKSTAEAIQDLKNDGYRIVATTPHQMSCTPETFDVTKGKFMIVLGTEKTGVSDEMLAAADEYMHIPMCGMVESLNVSASAAIIIYMLSQRLRESDIDWHLNKEKHTRILYRWMCKAVRDSRMLLEKKFTSK